MIQRKKCLKNRKKTKSNSPGNNILFVNGIPEARAKARQILSKAKKKTKRGDSLARRKVITAFSKDVYKEFKRQGKKTLEFLTNRKLKQTENYARKKYPKVYEKGYIPPQVIPVNYYTADGTLVDSNEVILDKQGGIYEKKISPADKAFLDKWIRGWETKVKPEQMEKVMKKWMPKAAELGGNEALQRMGLSLAFHLKDPKIIKELASRGLKITGGITKKTVKDFQGRMYKSYMEQGLSPYDVKKQIKGLFSETYRNRSMTIARTETLVASSTAQFKTYLENDVKKKQWFSIVDPQTRPSHVVVDGQTRGINEAFDVSGVPMMHPGDSSAPAHEIVNCRCDMLAIVTEKINPLEAWTGG